VLIDLFSLDVMAEAQAPRAKILVDRKSAAPSTILLIFLSQNYRANDLSCGVRMQAQLSSSPSDRTTREKKENIKKKHK